MSPNNIRQSLLRALGRLWNYHNQLLYSLFNTLLYIVVCGTGSTCEFKVVHGFGRPADWVGLGRFGSDWVHIFQFLVVKVGLTVPKVLYFYERHIKSTEH